MEGHSLSVALEIVVLWRMWLEGLEAYFVAQFGLEETRVHQGERLSA